MLDAPALGVSVDRWPSVGAAVLSLAGVDFVQFAGLRSQALLSRWKVYLLRVMPDSASVCMSCSLCVFANFCCHASGMTAVCCNIA